MQHPEPGRLDDRLAVELVGSVLGCIDREYPHSQRCWLESDADLLPPRVQMPVFYGCLDWHSAVHGHWLLIRLCRYFPAASFQASVRAALDRSFTPAKIQGEIDHLHRHPYFECPYGFAWLLQLTSELREWADPQAQNWLSRLMPLETAIATNFYRWLERLEYPDRTGTHNQTAFALGLVLDWARVAEREDLAEPIRSQARAFYGNDRDYPTQIEPLAYDFLSPSLAAADLMRRLLAPNDFAQWLGEFLPRLQAGEIACWQPLPITHPHDYMYSHFRGLNLSRAWMMAGIVAGLPPEDPRIEILSGSIDCHRDCGLDDVSCADYSSSHWLGTFAVYLETHRGNR